MNDSSAKKKMKSRVRIFGTVYYRLMVTLEYVIFQNPLEFFKLFNYYFWPYFSEVSFQKLSLSIMPR